MEWMINHESELLEVAEYIVNQLERTPLVLLVGELGAGKTRLVKYAVRTMGSDDEVTSPTFAVINEYRSGGQTIYHMDMYRIKDVDEAIQIGVEEYLDSGCPCFIEWPEVLEPLIENGSLVVRIEVISPNVRKVIV